jgi:ElaB/YqjD/DUF883 family membrane-anchored ribosome-binding protein
MVTQQQLAGYWQTIKDRVQKRWAGVTDQDLAEAEGNVEGLIGLIQRKAGESREAIENFLHEIVASGSSMMHDGADRAREYVHVAGQRLGQAYDRVAENLHDGYQRAEKYVQHNPAQSVAIAFGAGVLTGLILGIALRR